MTNPDRPLYDGREYTRAQVAPPVGPLSTVTPMVPPRVRRNYTQGAKGEWRAEFTIESYHDPLLFTGISAIAEEDDAVRKEVIAVLAELNGGSDSDGG